MSVVNRLRVMWQRFGPRARDIGFMLISLITTLAIAAHHRYEGVAVWSSMLILGLLGTLALWWRRRFPGAVTLAGISIFIVAANPIPMAVGLFSLAIRRRDLLLVAATAAVAAAIAVEQGMADGNSYWLGFVLIGIVEAGFCAAAGAYIGARHDLLASVVERAKRAEEEREARADQARLAERARIAGEMHDVLAHKVSLIALHAGGLEVNASVAPDEARRTAALIRTIAREAMDDLRDVLGLLRIDDDSDVSRFDRPPSSTSADLTRIVDASRAAGVDVELSTTTGVLPDAVGRTVCRVVQEGLTNVHKYAHGSCVSVSVVGNCERGVTVEVVNSPPQAQPDPLPGSGAGLVGLTQRLRLLGGSLNAGRSADGGWRLAGWLPWDPQGDASVQRKYM